MDTDVDENDPWNRELSARLYSGDSEMRIRQEMLLGIGGVRVIRALGYAPKAWHMNEGHSTFLVLECIREKVAAGQSFAQAAQEVKDCTIFTTHTPVPAGHDAFPFQVVEKYFKGYWDELGISLEELLALGSHREAWGTAFNMTVMALRMSGQANAVSELHGQVSRDMWQEVWPGTPVNEVPIIHVTNGVHIPTWISTGLYDLYKLYLGPKWHQNQDDPQIWERMANMPDEVLWDLHMMMKGKLMSYITDNARRRWLEGTTDPAQILTGGTLLDPNALTIGFARRFATYKRATLIFQDIERLRKIMLDIHRPVQFVFAGKAHPADDPGKSMIQQVYNMAKSHEMGGRIAFIENYNMHSAHYLVQGVDVWMNNPRRPREASGTSGMKAAMNGIPNLSILDGWWVEGYNGANGWAVGSQEPYDSDYDEDLGDANSIYDLLENEIVPLYYGRDRDEIPRGWVEVMRESIRSTSPQFSMSRMLKDYTRKMYINALRHSVSAETE
jgi:starch phosphorylase